jgi:hypothetical protein
MDTWPQLTLAESLSQESGVRTLKIQGSNSQDAKSNYIRKSQSAEI